MRVFVLLVLSAVLAISPGSAVSSARDAVQLARVPNGGIQPDASVDAAGVVHLVYLAGEPASADVFYVRSSDGGLTFSLPVRVNSQAGSAIATGTIRGAQIAVGRNGRVHVAWNGSDKALPKAPPNPTTNLPSAPMLYARSNAAGTAFEPQRNLIAQTTNLDGGGSVAADERGGVYVAWHGQPANVQGGEEARRVWIARSLDDGATFGSEAPVSDPATGVCGCCALRLFAAPGGELHLLYRSATDKTHRDIYSLVSSDRGRTFSGTRLDAWDIGACPMTSMSMASRGTVLGAWETAGQVYYQPLESGSSPTAPPGAEAETDRADHAKGPHANHAHGVQSATAGMARARKHPRLAVDRDGTVLLAWTEGTAWARGGSLAWQAFGRDGRPTAVNGMRRGVPVWSFGAVIPRADGGFTILY